MTTNFHDRCTLEAVHKAHVPSERETYPTITVDGTAKTVFTYLSAYTSAYFTLKSVYLSQHTTSMTLADYLAKNYLSADNPKQSKKRKRKAAERAGLVIADDDVSGWNNSSSKHADSDDESPMVIPGRGFSSTGASTKTTTWKTVGVAAPKNDEQAAADAILAQAAAETKTRADEEDDAPAIVGNVEGDYGMDGPQMANGAMAGLQTAEQVTAALKKREKEERRKMVEAGLDAGGKAQETIYRDASGRIINVAMKRAELRRKAEEEEKKKIENQESAKGDVQRREKEERARRLDDAKTLKVSRYADDEEMNAELKEKDRWNDPAMQFLSTGTGGTKGKSKSSRKVYMGASEPNRYGIKPGYRWDGVDRSTHFERKWFAARNKITANKDLEYAWEMDE